MIMLKEWSTVVGALESGEQCVILRKGGIMETASGFRLESRRFLLYPTWEHQTAANIREPYRAHLGRERPDSGTNRISSYAEVLEEADVSSDRTIERLERFHIWSSEYVNARRQWQPERPIKAVFLKTFRIESVTIPILGEYAGCKSWLELDIGPCSGRQVLVSAQVESRLKEFREAVA